MTRHLLTDSSVVIRCAQCSTMAAQLNTDGTISWRSKHHGEFHTTTLDAKELVRLLELLGYMVHINVDITPRQELAPVL